MDIRKVHKYYRSSRVDVNGVLWRMLYNDNELKKFLHLSPYCATFSILVMALLVFIYSITSANVVDSDEKTFRGLQSETNELRQIDVFQEKARRLLCKERLELNIVNSRMSCIMTLLQPEMNLPQSWSPQAAIQKHAGGEQLLY